MSKIGKPEKMIIDGKRLDGRGLEEFRPLTAEVGVLRRADGSAIFRYGDTYALAGVFGPKPMHPRHLQDPQKAVLKCKYSMAPFSTKERIRPGRSRRATEISKVLKEALSNVVFFEDYPKTGIEVFVVILQANASTRCAGLNAASLALAEAGISMRNLISACTVGKIDGQIVLDVGGDEDQFGDVDVAFATIGNQDKIVLFQMDGIVTKEEFLKMIDLAKRGCAQIFEKQVNALREKYKTGEENVEND